jgi:molybdate transport repressor ModE-like protein
MNQQYDVSKEIDVTISEEVNDVKIGAVIVAAGMSTRMKDFKQLMKIGDLTMVERVVINFLRCGVKDIVMITGYRGEEVEKSLRHYGITFLRNENYETTQMFDSAKIGLKYLQDRCDKVFFCPADVAFFSANTVKSLLALDGKLVYPICQNRIGHPIRIDTDLIPAILSYEGGRGLKGALDSLQVTPTRIEVDDEGSITDADTPGDYEHLVEMHNENLLRAGVKVWLMRRRTFFGPGTLTLLREIDSLCSVREACKKTGISYSKGWNIIHAAEEELGYPIVIRQTGGKNGGAAYLSEEGRQLMELYETYEQRVGEAADQIFQEVFRDQKLF